MKTFKALVVTETSDNRFVRSIIKKSTNDLPAGDVLVRVHYSSLNYKDGLSASGNKGVTKKYPHTPGVDAAGVVEESNVENVLPGDKVIVAGFDLGSNTDGGFAEYIRVPADWVMKLPETLTLRESMVFGSAGYTAGLSVYKLMACGITPEMGPVLVTGATGGVGSVSVAILAREGFHVVATTGKLDEQDFLLELGAREVVRREDIRDTTGKPLLSGRWGAVVDTVGGEYLDAAIRATKLEGAVACSGNVVSGELHTSVYPFILRGVTLFGINSAFTPMHLRRKVWQKLSNEWKLPHLDSLATEITIDELDRYIDLILNGRIRGRVVVNLLSQEGSEGLQRDK